MRYPDGGGLTAEGRAKREAVRLQAARWFAEDVPAAEIARRLRVSENAVYTWRRRWRVGGEAALLSKGPSGSPCRLSDEQVAQLAAALIARLFRQRYTLRGVSYLLHRMGFTHQVPKHRPVERDEQAIASWRREVWPRAKR